MPSSAEWSVDRTQVPLSGSVAVTVRIRGGAPLRVEVPKAVLADESAAFWELTPSGPARLVEQPAGEQLWTQEFAASPFAPGTVPLALQPFAVAAGSEVASRNLTFEPKSIRVDRTIQKIDAAEAVPVTDIEQIPDEPPTSEVVPGVWLFTGVVALLLLAGAIAALRRKKPVPVETPRERIDRELAELPGRGDIPHRLAAILRNWLRATAGIPAETRTTAELAAVFPDETLISILRECDGARFGLESDFDSGAIIDRTRAWLLQSGV